MRRLDYGPEPEKFSTGFPLLVIGSAIGLIVVYLIIMGDLLEPKKPLAKIYVPVASETISKPAANPSQRTTRVLAMPPELASY